MNEMLGSINTSSALAAFERMEEKGRVPIHRGLSRACVTITREFYGCSDGFGSRVGCFE